MHLRIVFVILATTTPSLAGRMVANPASVRCVQHGATIVMESDENGSQRGVCVFPDGTRIPEWTYFRSKSRLAK